MSFLLRCFRGLHPLRNGMFVFAIMAQTSCSTFHHIGRGQPLTPEIIYSRVRLGHSHRFTLHSGEVQEVILTNKDSIGVQGRLKGEMVNGKRQFHSFSKTYDEIVSGYSKVAVWETDTGLSIAAVCGVLLLPIWYIDRVLSSVDDQK